MTVVYLLAQVTVTSFLGTFALRSILGSQKSKQQSESDDDSFAFPLEEDSSSDGQNPYATPNPELDLAQLQMSFVRAFLISAIASVGFLAVMFGFFVATQTNPQVVPFGVLFVAVAGGILVMVFRFMIPTSFREAIRVALLFGLALIAISLTLSMIMQLVRQLG